jgi:hypothetical protein
LLLRETESPRETSVRIAQVPGHFPKDHLSECEVEALTAVLRLSDNPVFSLSLSLSLSFVPSQSLHVPCILTERVFSVYATLIS